MGINVYFMLREMKKESVLINRNFKGIYISSMEEWKVGWI